MRTIVFTLFADVVFCCFVVKRSMKMFEKDRKRVSNRLGRFVSRRGDHLLDPLGFRYHLCGAFLLSLLQKPKRAANKNNNKKNNTFASFSSPKEQSKRPPKSKEKRTCDGDDAIDYSARERIIHPKLNRFFRGEKRAKSNIYSE